MIHSNKERKDYSFQFKNQSDILEILGCSKPYFNKLCRKNIISPHYLEKDEHGNPTGKKYYNLAEIEAAFFKEDNS